MSYLLTKYFLQHKILKHVKIVQQPEVKL